MKKILLAVAMLSTISFSSCNSSGGGDPKAVLTSFFEALSKNDIEAARKLATKDSKQMIDMMEMGLKMGKDKKLGLLSLTALVITSSIGAGIFNISGDLASGAAAGPAIIAWIIVGIGILMLSLSFNNLLLKKPELNGIFSYA